MTDLIDNLVAAEANAALARERLSLTVQEARVRLNPRRLAREAGRDVADRTIGLARDGSETIRSSPGVTVGVVALVAAIFGRRRIAALFRRRSR